MYNTSSGKNNDKNTGRGEQVTGHHLPGAGNNYERKTLDNAVVYKIPLTIEKTLKKLKEAEY